MDLVLNDKFNTKVITFTEIRFDIDDVLERVLFKLFVDFDVFNVELTTEAELSDFLSLKEGLLNIYSNKMKTYIFNPIGDLLFMKFDLEETGNINIEVVINNITFSGRLNFQFSMDQSFLPEIDESLECILSNVY